MIGAINDPRGVIINQNISELTEESQQTSRDSNQPESFPDGVMINGEDNHRGVVYESEHNITEGEQKLEAGNEEGMYYILITINETNGHKNGQSVNNIGSSLYQYSFMSGFFQYCRRRMVSTRYNPL